MTNNNYKLKTLMAKMEAAEDKLFHNQGEIDHLNKEKVSIGRKIQTTAFLLSLTDGLGFFFYWTYLTWIGSLFAHPSTWLRTRHANLYVELEDRIEYERELLDNHVAAVRARALVQIDVLELIRLMNCELAMGYSKTQLKDIQKVMKACKKLDLIGNF